MNKILGGILVGVPLVGVFGVTTYVYGFVESVIVWGISIIISSMIIGGVLLIFKD